MNSSDSAEEIVKISLEGIEVAFRITGDGAKNIIALIGTLMNDNQQTKGKTRLANMLKTGKALKIYTFRAEDLKKFSQEAKKYGVLYCALANKKNEKIDGQVDIMVREEDAVKVNRIAERFNFATVDTVSIQKELIKDKEKELKQEEINEQDKLIDDILGIQPSKEQNEIITPSNSRETEDESQLENFLNIKQNDREIIKKDKKSVRAELSKIQKEIADKKTKTKQHNKVVNHSKNYNEKRKGKHLKEGKHFEKTKKKMRKLKHRERERSK